MIKDCKIEEECSCLIFVNLFFISNMVAILLIFYSVDVVKSYLYLLKTWNIANHRFAQSQLKTVYLVLQ